MDDPRPLDYASPNAPAPPPVPLTPEQLRARRRRRAKVALAVLLSLTPYPRQVCPSIKFQVVDQSGQPVTDLLHASWGAYGGTARERTGNCSFDLSGKAAVDRQWAWASPVRRFLSILGGCMPHGGFPGDPFVDVRVTVPTGWRLDTDAMGLTPDPLWNGTSRREWRDPRTADRWCDNDSNSAQQAILVRIEHSGRWGASDYPFRIVLRRAPGNAHAPPASVPPTTRPGA